MFCVTLIIGFLVLLRLTILENLSGVTLIIALRLLESEEYLVNIFSHFDDLVYDRTGCFGRIFGRTEPKRFGSVSVRFSTETKGSVNQFLLDKSL